MNARQNWIRTVVLGQRGVAESFSQAASLVMIGSVVGLLALLGYYKVEQLNPAIVLVSGGLHFLLIALVEELDFRVICFKLLKELFGSWIALVSTCILFGLLHLVNPNATWSSAFSVAVHSLAWVAAYMLTRRIWLAAGIHFAWNFAQSCIFGILGRVLD